MEGKKRISGDAVVQEPALIAFSRGEKPEEGVEYGGVFYNHNRDYMARLFRIFDGMMKSGFRRVITESDNLYRKFARFITDDAKVPETVGTNVFEDTVSFEAGWGEMVQPYVEREPVKFYRKGRDSEFQIFKATLCDDNKRSGVKLLAIRSGVGGQTDSDGNDEASDDRGYQQRFIEDQRVFIEKLRELLEEVRDRKGLTRAEGNVLEYLKRVYRFLDSIGIYGKVDDNKYRMAKYLLNVTFKHPIDKWATLEGVTGLLRPELRLTPEELFEQLKDEWRKSVRRGLPVYYIPFMSSISSLLLDRELDWYGENIRSFIYRYCNHPGDRGDSKVCDEISYDDIWNGDNVEFLQRMEGRLEECFKDVQRMFREAKDLNQIGFGEVYEKLLTGGYRDTRAFSPSSQFPQEFKLATIVESNKEKIGKAHYGIISVPQVRRFRIFADCRNIRKDKRIIADSVRKVFNAINFYSFHPRAKLRYFLTEVEDIETVIPFFYELAEASIGSGRNRKKTFSGNTAVKMLFSMLHFCAYICHAIRNHEGAFLIISDRLISGNGENGRERRDRKIAFFDVFNLLYSFMGVPLQTLTESTISAMENQAVAKNSAISLYKDCKKLEMSIHSNDGGNPWQDGEKFYLFVECSSQAFGYRKNSGLDSFTSGIRHYLIETYEIEHIGSGKFSVWKSDKFAMMGASDRAVNLKDYLSRIKDGDSKMAVIYGGIRHTTSYLKNIIQRERDLEDLRKRTVFMIHTQSPLPFYCRPTRWEPVRNAIIISYDVVKDAVKRKFNITSQLMEEDDSSYYIVIKPSFPPALIRRDEKSVIHRTHLQVFRIPASEDIFLKDRIDEYMQKLIQALLLYLSYESESFNHIVVKPEITSQIRSGLKVNRKSNDGSVHYSYNIPSSALVIELVKFVLDYRPSVPNLSMSDSDARLIGDSP